MTKTKKTAKPAPKKTSGGPCLSDCVGVEVRGEPISRHSPMQAGEH